MSPLERARQLRQAGEYEMALAALNEARSEGTIEYHIESFRLAWLMSDVDIAHQSAYKVHEMNASRAVQILCQLGQLLNAKGRPAEAEQAFLRAQSVAASTSQELPDWFAAGLSAAHLRNENWREAIAVAQNNVTQKPVLGLTIVQALVGLRNFRDAREELVRVVRALAAEPGRESAIEAACVLLLRADPSPRSAAAVTSVAGTFSWSSRLQALAARAEVQAVSSSEGDLDLQAAVLEKPNDRATLNRWLSALQSTLSPGEIIEALVQTQREHVELLPILLLELSNTLNTPDLLRLFPAQIERFRTSETFAACSRFFHRLFSFSQPTASDASIVASLPDSVVHMYLRFRSPSPRRILLRKPTPLDVEFMYRSGIVYSDLVQFTEKFLDYGSEEWRCYLDQARFASKTAQRRVLNVERHVGFQDRIAKTRRLQIMDPYSGALQSPFDSVVVFDRQVFTFRGQRSFALLTGGAGVKALCLYLFEENVILDLDAQLPRYVSDLLVCNVLTHIIKRAARNVDSFLDAAERVLVAPPERDIVAVHGSIENFAHHVWNHHSGFERIVVAGAASNVVRVIRRSQEYFGPFEELFPEFKHVVDVPKTALIDPCPFSVNELVLQPGGYFISCNLLKRIRRVAATRANASEIERLAQNRTVVWIGVRVGDKSWVSQIEGILFVMDRIRREFQDVLFVLDAFTLPVDAASIPSRWKGAYDKLVEIVDAITARAPDPDAIVSLVGRSLAESTLWAQHVDAYLTPLGTTQHKVGWFTSAPGVIYTSEALAKVPVDMRPGSWEAEGISLPTYVIGKTVDAGQRRGFDDLRGNLDNIQVEPQEIADQLITQLKDRKASRFRHASARCELTD